MHAEILEWWDGFGMGSVSCGFVCGAFSGEVVRGR